MVSGLDLRMAPFRDSVSTRDMSHSRQIEDLETVIFTSRSYVNTDTYARTRLAGGMSGYV